MRELKDFILVVPNAVNETLRTKILQEYADSEEWEEAFVGDNPIVDRTTRYVFEIPMSDQSVINKNNEVRTAIDKELFACAVFVLREYQKKFLTFAKIFIQDDEGYTLLRYEKNQFFSEHVDATRLNFRSVSCSFAVNDNYSGGEWSFFNGVYMTKLSAGDAILFPSNFLYPHSIRPVLSGTRYSIVTWFR